MIFHRNTKWLVTNSLKFPHLLLRCCGASTSAGLRPRRTLLYVPGNEEKKVKKAAGLQADAVVMDCEDGVALNKKDETRFELELWAFYFLVRCNDRS